MLGQNFDFEQAQDEIVECDALAMAVECFGLKSFADMQWLLVSAIWWQAEIVLYDERRVRASDS